MTDDWTRQQEELRSRLILTSGLGTVSTVCGLDISYVKGSQSEAVCTAVLLSYPDLTLKHSVTLPITITEPYIPGFLAFREAPHYIMIYHRLVQESGIVPDLILLDGNGILHQNGCGLASHVGVLLDRPTIGCAKSYFHIDGLEETTETDHISVLSLNGSPLALVYRHNIKPVYLSQGHRTSWSDVHWAVSLFRYREPEPTRLADRLSREYIRENNL